METTQILSVHLLFCFLLIVSSYLDLRIQQRKGNKYITIIEGIPDEYDLKKMLRSWKKVKLKHTKI